MSKLTRKQFKMPDAYTITGRNSTIIAAVSKTLTPKIRPKKEEVEAVLEVFGMTLDNSTCAYCGDSWILWDHYQPIIRDKRPTGFITEINNLLPCCHICNTSKGNRVALDWVGSEIANSPKSRGVDIAKIKINLERFDRLPRKKIKVTAKISGEIEELFEEVEGVLNLFVGLQRKAEEIRGSIESTLG